MTLVGGLVVFAVLVFRGLPATEWWQNAGGLLRMAIGGVGFLGLVVVPVKIVGAIVRHGNHLRPINDIRLALGNPAMPELDPQRARWHYRYRADDATSHVIQRIQLVLDKGQARAAVLEHEDLSQVASAEERWKIVASRETAGVAGLHYLAQDVREAVHLALTIKAMQAAKAPPEFVRPLEDEWRRVNRYKVARSLFDPAALERADMTPGSDAASTYFTKYFQPLLMAFGQKDFEKSALTDEDHAEHALNDHLRELEAGRVAAGCLDEGGEAELINRLRARLPQPVKATPAGRKISREHNTKRAAHSVLLTASARAKDRARAVEFQMRPEECFERAGFTCAAWTPRLDQELHTYCFLWQKSRRKD